jgi:hypothetical protein
MTKLRALLIATVLAATVALAGAATLADNPVTGDAEPAAAFQFTSYSSCNQSGHLGYRVCYDVGDKWVYIYNSSSTSDYTPDIAFPSNSGVDGIGTYTGYRGIWTSAESNWNGAWPLYVPVQDVTGEHIGVGMAYYNQACHDAGNQICVYGGNFNYIAWYANTPGFEFVVTTY